MVLGQSEDGEAFGDIVLEPCGQFWRGFTVAGDQGDQFGLCLVGGIGVPDRSQLRADPFTGSRIGRVMDRVLRQVELASLPDGSAEHGAACSAQAGMIVRDDELDPAHAALDEAFEEGPPVHFGFGQGHRDAQHPAALVRPDPDRR